LIVLILLFLLLIIIVIVSRSRSSRSRSSSRRRGAIDEQTRWRGPHHVQSAPVAKPHPR
jgi:ABC-type Fe3+ transport system permease subunit